MGIYKLNMDEVFMLTALAESRKAGKIVRVGLCADEVNAFLRKYLLK